MKITRSIFNRGSKEWGNLRQSRHDASWMEAPLCLDHGRAAACGADYLLLSPTTSSSSPALWCGRKPEWVGAARVLLHLFVGALAWPQRHFYVHAGLVATASSLAHQPAE